MMASEFIKKLQVLMSIYGDRPLVDAYDHDISDPEMCPPVNTSADHTDDLAFVIAEKA